MKNLKVSQKLIVGFLIVSLLTAAVGLIGTTNIRKISENEADLYAHHTIPTGILVQLTTDVYTLRLYVAKAALSKSPEEWQPAIEAIGKIRAKIEEDMQQYFQAIGKDDLKAQAIGKEFESKYKEYFTYVDQEISYLNQGNTSAVAEMVKPTAAFSKTGAALGEIAGKMREELVAGAKAVSDQNMQQANQIILIMRIIMAIAVVLAMLIGLFISRMISRPIRMIKEAADNLAQGDLNIQLNYQSKDEAGQVVKSFERVIGNIKELITESQLLKNAAIEGNLDKRGNTALFEGSFKELINGTNAIMDTLTGHIDTIPSPIVLIDEQYNLKYANAMAAKLVNKTQSELIGHKCFDELCSSVCNNDQCPGRISFGQGMKAQSEAKAGPMDVSIS
ncbi:MAG: MCP four helix bundle domain-containing protein, partial [Bacillota bacterium]